MARSVDSDRKHLQSVLRAAADHRGSAFIEIFQNCPIFNDDAFAPIKEPNAPGLIRLEHGSPVRFGPDGSMGLTYGPYGALTPVEAASVPESELRRARRDQDRPVVRVRALPARQLRLRAHPDRRVPRRSSARPTTT